MVGPNVASKLYGSAIRGSQGQHAAKCLEHYPFTDICQRPGLPGLPLLRMRPLDWQDLQHLMSTQVGCPKEKLRGHEEVLRIRDSRSDYAGVRGCAGEPNAGRDLYKRATR